MKRGPLPINRKGSIMTGKQLKAFAAQVPDDAEIEVQTHHVYPERWDALKPTRIRSIETRILMPEAASELQLLQTVNG